MSALAKRLRVQQAGTTNGGTGSRGAKRAKKGSNAHKRPAAKPGGSAPPPEDASDSGGSDDGADLDLADGGAAYEALLSSFARGRGSSAALLRQWQHEVAGDSASEDEGEEGSSEEDAHAGSSSDEGEEEGSDGSSNGQDEEPAAGAADGADGDDADSGSGSGSEEEEGGPSLHAGGVTAGAGDPAGAGPGSSPLDVWEAHFERQLTEAEVGELGEAARWADAKFAPAGAGARLWRHARWQVAGRPGGLPAAPATLDGYGVKERVAARWREVHAEDAARDASGGHASTSGRAGGGDDASGDLAAAAAGGFVSPQQRQLFALLNSYADVLFTGKPYPASAAAPDWAMDAVLLHALNHVAKAGDRIKRNNERLKGAEAAAQGGGGKRGGGGGNVAVEDVPRDQGFTRPKVLLLLPMRNQALRVVRRLVALALKETRGDSVQGKERLLEQFTDPDRPEEPHGQPTDPQAAARASRKPADHRALFSGNTDDMFWLGVKLTRGSVRLFADPFQSDVLVASPLALATRLAETGTPAAGGGDGGRGGGARHGSAASDTLDFLSSVEVVLVERCDVLAMQNWAHVVTVLEHLNRIPRDQHGGDIMRVREGYLSGRGRWYRQTIMTEGWASADVNGAFGRLAGSHAGRARLLAEPPGVLGAVLPQVRQLFERFEAPDAAAAGDARLAFFQAHVWPRLAAGAGTGLLLFVPSYFDFVRLRNFFKGEDVSFAALSEYTSGAASTRARALFAQGRRRLLLYTERAHFYFRCRIRGIRDVLFYGPPDHADYYPELLNLIEGAGGAGSGAAAAAAAHAAVGLLFCRWDALALARLVGQGRARKMLAPRAAPTYMFC